MTKLICAVGTSKLPRGLAQEEAGYLTDQLDLTSWFTDMNSLFTGKLK